MIEKPKEIEKIIDKMPDHWFEWSHEEKIDATFDRQLARSLGKIEEAGRLTPEVARSVKTAFSYLRDDVKAAMWWHAAESDLAFRLADRIDAMLADCKTSEAEECLGELQDMCDDVFGEEVAQ